MNRSKTLLQTYRRTLQVRFVEKYNVLLQVVKLKIYEDMTRNRDPHLKPSYKLLNPRRQNGKMQGLYTRL